MIDSEEFLKMLFLNPKYQYNIINKEYKLMIKSMQYIILYYITNYNTKTLNWVTFKK